MRVMIDTNVMLSAIIFCSGNTTHTIDIATHYGNKLLLSTFIIDEAYDVVTRKWPDNVGALGHVLQRLHAEVIITPIHPEPGLFKIRDPNDYPVLIFGDYR